MTDLPPLAERLRDEREWLGLTLDHIGTVLGVQGIHVAAMERGDIVPTDKELTKLARLYGLTVARLQGEPLAEEPGGVQALAGRTVSPEDRYHVHRFAEYLRHAGPAPEVRP